jgi:transcriptional regulator with XRE-family HTH domain|tara:strand:+ start:3761 stop:3946 length:186 start_codon:yes stop_codon:yes gene_type:complete
MITINEMTNDLLSSGLSQLALAKLAGTSQAQVWRIANGQEPRYRLGKTIEKIYGEQLQRSA